MIFDVYYQHGKKKHIHSRILLLLFCMLFTIVKSKNKTMVKTWWFLSRQVNTCLVFLVVNEVVDVILPIEQIHARIPYGRTIWLQEEGRKVFFFFFFFFFF